MIRKSLSVAGIGSIFLIFSHFSFAYNTAPVTGYARDLTTSKRITDATVTILENGEHIKLDNQGRFGPIMWPVGTPITLVLEKLGYRTTQTATVIVPPEGLTTIYNEITLEAADLVSFYMLAGAMGKQLNEEKCHVATTITAYHKTLYDLPQGEAFSKILITPSTIEIPYYYDIFTSGPLKDYPNPFTRGLIQTTADGGVIFANMEPRTEPYVLTAYKAGKMFEQTQVLCRKGMFINASPPHGPTALS